MPSKQARQPIPMTPVEEQDALYVIQNEWGSIKIGRSWAPKRRVSQLSRTEGCRIIPVTVVDLCGPWEGHVHHQLRRHHLRDEWFAGTDAAREAVDKALRHAGPLEWSIEYKPDAEREWLGRLELARAARRRSRHILQEIEAIERPDRPSSHDRWFLLGMAQLVGPDVFTRVLGDNAELFLRRWYTLPQKGLELIPAFAEDVDAALKLWPDDIRPKGWDGTARECCVALLRTLQFYKGTTFSHHPESGPG